MTAPRPRAPRGLASAGRGFWREVTSTYGLRPDELRLLGEACRELDLIESMRELVAVDGLTAAGSKGQPVAHPLVAELRHHRHLLAGLLARLGLPDGGAVPQNDLARARSAMARKAARARWDA